MAKGEEEQHDTKPEGNPHTTDSSWDLPKWMLNKSLDALQWLGEDVITKSGIRTPLTPKWRLRYGLPDGNYENAQPYKTLRRLFGGLARVQNLHERALRMETDWDSNNGATQTRDKVVKEYMSLGIYTNAIQRDGQTGETDTSDDLGSGQFIPNTYDERSAVKFGCHLDLRGAKKRHLEWIKREFDKYQDKEIDYLVGVQRKQEKEVQAVEEANKFRDVKYQFYPKPVITMKVKGPAENVARVKANYQLNKEPTTAESGFLEYECDFWFPVPFEVSIPHPKVAEYNMEYRISQFGSDLRSTHQSLMDSLLDDIRQFTIAVTGDDQANFVNQIIIGPEKQNLDTTYGEIYNFEDEWWKELSDITGDGSELSTFRNNVNDANPDTMFMEFQHSFEVLDTNGMRKEYKKFKEQNSAFHVKDEEKIPHVVKNFASQEIRDEYEQKLRKDYGDDVHIETREYTNSNGKTRYVIGHSVPGLDEHGMPLEVGNGKRGSKDKLLADVYANQIAIEKGKDPHEIRSVSNTKFVRPWDLLDTATWVDNYYDPLRDDIRDGRHHPGSQTIMERFYAYYGIPQVSGINDEGELAGDEDPDSKGILEYGRNNRRRYRKHQHMRYKMRMFDGHQPYFKSGQAGPNMFDPAFDTRLVERGFHLNRELGFGKVKNENIFDIHRGRRFYHEVQETIAKAPPNRVTMGSRGTSMFIIDHVLENMKKWEDARKLLTFIGEKIDGYDVGPNLGGWGKHFSKDPFVRRRKESAH